MLLQERYVRFFVYPRIAGAKNMKANLKNSLVILDCSFWGVVSQLIQDYPSNYYSLSFGIGLRVLLRSSNFRLLFFPIIKNLHYMVRRLRAVYLNEEQDRIFLEMMKEDHFSSISAFFGFLITQEEKRRKAGK